MNTGYPHLFSPIRIGNVTFRNRIFATPTTSLSDLQSQIAFFENKARGGAAQVCLGETAVSSKYLLEPKGTTFVLDGDERDMGLLTEFVTSMNAYGAVPSVQLNHHGQQVRPDRNDGRSPVGPMGYVREDGVKVVAMDEDMIEEAIEAYGNAAFFANGPDSRCALSMGRTAGSSPNSFHDSITSGPTGGEGAWKTGLASGWRSSTASVRNVGGTSLSNIG